MQNLFQRTEQDNPNNFKPQKPVDAFGEKKKDTTVNKKQSNPIRKKAIKRGAQQNEKVNPTALK